MLVYRLFSFFFFFISLFSPAYTTETLLTARDVQKTMDQFFEYHIEQKEMSGALLQRGLKIFLDHFDPSHAYLLENEIHPYLYPNKRLLRKIFFEYKADRFPVFFALTENIQNSILRARQWRQEWESDPAYLVKQAAEFCGDEKREKDFSNDLNELKERHRDRVLRFLAMQLEQLEPYLAEGMEDKFVALCEKQISSIENEYLGLDEWGNRVTRAEMEHFVILKILKALANSLDAHTAYYSSDEAFAMKVQLEKGMCGIGVVLKEGIEGIIIHELVKDGPADKCKKLEVGDTIVEIDGEPIKNFSFQHLLEKMRGREGTKTILGVIRPQEFKNDLRRVELVRSKIAIDDKRVDVETEPFGDGLIGKITLHSFYEGANGDSESDLKAAIEALRAQGNVHGLVLDMRENSGGFLTQAVRVSGLFISNGVVVISKYSDGKIKYYRALEGERYYDGPLVILISRGSASATEIVAQALKDYGIAIVVGDEQTFGKGTIQHQTVTTDENEAFFKVTVGKYYTVSGQSPQGQGVISDIVVPTENNFEEIGERYLDFPITADTVASAFDDPLTDVEPFTRRWFRSYYQASLQQKDERWRALIPILKKNSLTRVEQNHNFQLFIDEVKNRADVAYGDNDLQMEEAVNILKDMIFLSTTSN